MDGDIVEEMATVVDTEDVDSGVGTVSCVALRDGWGSVEAIAPGRWWCCFGEVATGVGDAMSTSGGMRVGAGVGAVS